MLDAAREDCKEHKKLRMVAEAACAATLTDNVKLTETMHLKIQLAVAETQNKCSQALLSCYEKQADRAAQRPRPLPSGSANSAWSTDDPDYLAAGCLQRP